MEKKTAGPGSATAGADYNSAAANRGTEHPPETDNGHRRDAPMPPSPGMTTGPPAITTTTRPAPIASRLAARHTITIQHGPTAAEMTTATGTTTTTGPTPAPGLERIGTTDPAPPAFHLPDPSGTTADGTRRENAANAGSSGTAPHLSDHNDISIGTIEDKITVIITGSGSGNPPAEITLETKTGCSQTTQISLTRSE